MERRKLLKSLAAVPAALIGAGQVGRKYEIKPEKKYVVFLNGLLVHPEQFLDQRHGSIPAGTPIYTVYPTNGESMDELVRIYEVE